MPKSSRTGPPSSVTSQATAIVGLLGFLAGLAVLNRVNLGQVDATVLAMLATALPMIVYELAVLRVHRMPSTGLTGFSLGRVGATNWQRLFVKLLGLWGTLALVAFAYWLFPEYSRPFYDPFWIFCRAYWPGFVLVSTVYFWLVDRWMTDPEDEYYKAGRLFLGQLPAEDRAELRKYFLGWVIKGFFLPLMFVYFSGSVSYLTSTSFVEVSRYLGGFVGYVTALSVGIDLAFVSIGYVLTLRLTNSHIRSPNNLFWGWIVTLLVYAPFFSLFGNRYLGYNDNSNWLDMFGPGWGVVVYAWGFAIVATKIVWVWANMSFGIRFSNLTNRGIITNGPYRWFRHPSYLFKNISWWLLSVPFFSVEGYETALRHTLLLVGVNTIYFLRAKAEEIHLSQDPTYVEYALWVEENGALRWLRNVLPFIRYVPPQAARPIAEG